MRKGLYQGVSLLLVALMFISSIGPMAYAESETTYGSALQHLGIIKGETRNGIPTGNLGGDKALTRGELVAIITTLTTESYDTFVLPLEASFTDVPTNHWAYEFVERAKANNVTQGVGNGKFGINDKVTYKQAQAFMLNMLGYTIEWNDVEHYANELGIQCDEAMNATTFTRDMMFEVLWYSLMAPTSYDKNFIDKVRETGRFELTGSDVQYAYQWNYTFLEQRAAKENLSVEDFLINVSDFNIDSQAPAWSEADHDIRGLYATRFYLHYYNNVTFRPCAYQTYYTAFESIERFSYLEYGGMIYDAETQTSYDYVIKCYKDGTITMAFVDPDDSTVKFEEIQMHLDSIWKSNPHPKNNALTTYIINVSVENDRSITFKITGTIIKKHSL